jgi:PAS domain S-box-containing protein
MKYLLPLTMLAPAYLYAHSDGVELSSVLTILSSMGLSYTLYLLYRLNLIKKERDQALEKQKADANILYLQSRYASMGETLANIAHQWKQPLNAIGTIQNNIKANLIYNGEISKEKLLSNVETSFRLLQHLGETIDTFYGFLAQQHRTDERFNISKPLDTIRKITEYSLENSHIKLRYDLQSDPEITGNVNEFTHALLNLILNAKDAFDETDAHEPTIIVRVRGEKSECSIEIIDNAGGIRLQPVDLVFSLHVTSKTDGSGLGLFMTKKIIETRFGGSIVAQNRNKGACFTITLPYLHDTLESSTFLTPEDKVNITNINRLANRVIELEEAKNTLTKWADIFQHAHWGIAIHLGKSNSFELINKAFETLYGYTPKELNALSVPDLFAFDSLPILEHAQKEAFEKGYVVFEAIHKRKDGTLFPVQIELIVVKNDEGDILYHIANVWDQTNKQKAEKELILMQIALNNTNEATYIIDKGSRFVQVNDGACRMLGYSREEFAAMSVYDIDTNATKEIVNNLKKMFETDGAIQFERQHKTKEGKIIDVEIIANFFEYDGERYSFSTVRDITEQKKAHAELLLRDFALNKINEAIYLIDENSMFHYVNDGACHVLGYTKEELLRLGVVDIDPNVSIEWWKEHWEDIIALGTTLTQTQHKRKDGALFPIEVSSNSFEYNGRWYSLAVSRDITDRVLLEAEKETRALKTIAENTPDNIIRWDIEGRYLYLNPVVERLLNVKAAEILGKRLDEAFPEIDLSSLDQAITQVVQTGEAIQSLRQFVPLAEGEMGIHEINLVPERDENGTIVSVLGVGRDMTDIYRLQNELAQREKELENSHAFLTKLIDSIPDPIFVKERDHTWILLNQAFCNLSGLSKEALIGKSDYDVFPKEEADIFWAKDEEVFDSNTLNVNEEAFTSSDGLTHHIQTVKAAFKDNDHKEYLVGTIRDISERKRAEEAIIELNNTLETKVKKRTLQLQQALDFNVGVINALPDLLFEVDRYGKYLGVWTRNPQLLAAQKEVLLNHSFHDILTPEATQISLDAIIEAEEHGLSFGKVIEIELVDGIHWFELSVSQKISEGTFIFISRDISERIKTDKKLRESEEMFRAIVESSPDVISRYDLSMRRIYVNPMMQFLLGKPLDEILGKTPYEFSPLPDIENFERLFHAVIEGKSEIEQEGPYITPWGEKRWGNQRIVPIFNDGHDVEGVMLIGRDITERFDHEKRLIMLESALNGSAEAIYINDAELNIIYVNDEACTMLGYTREEFMEMKITDIDADFSVEGIEDLLEIKRIHKKIFFRTRHRTKEGTIINVKISGSPFIHDENEIFVSVVKELSANN